MADFWDIYFKYLLLIVIFFFCLNVFLLVFPKRNMKPEKEFKKLGILTWTCVITLVTLYIIYFFFGWGLNIERFIDVRVFTIISILFSLIQLLDAKRDSPYFYQINVNIKCFLSLYILLLVKTGFETINKDKLSSVERAFENTAISISVVLSCFPLLIYAIGKMKKLINTL